MLNQYIRLREAAEAERKQAERSLNLCQHFEQKMQNFRSGLGAPLTDEQFRRWEESAKTRSALEKALHMVILKTSQVLSVPMVPDLHRSRDPVNSVPASGRLPDPSARILEKSGSTRGPNCRS